MPNDTQSTTEPAVETAKHTPGPWYLVEQNNEIRIYSDWNGRRGGVALSIGSVALSFRPRRQGSHRGEKMVYRPFSEQDRADARLIAAAPELLAFANKIAHLMPTREPEQTTTSVIDIAIYEARHLVAKAEGL